MKLYKSYQKFECFFVKKTKNKYRFKKKFPRFLIYTSGTTSAPKGVMLTDKSITNNINAINKDLNFNSNDKFLIFSPPNYAMELGQILSALSAKAQIYFYNNGLRLPSELVEIIMDKKISILNLLAFQLLEF